MRKTFAYGAATSQGSWPVQEDGYFADPGAGVFALADGFGGRGAGDLAAKQALLEVRNATKSPAPATVVHRELFAEIHRKLAQWNEKRVPATGGGCSLLLASVGHDAQVTVTGCGAGAVFLVRAGVWLPLLTPQAAPRREAGAPLFPTQALGVAREIYPESRTFLWYPGDIVFLFSSGLEWERDGFITGLNAELALRAPGGDLGAVANLATEGPGGLPPNWNQTALAVESLGDVSP